MPEIKEVHTYDHESSSTSNTLLVVVVVMAMLIVGLLVWQPWSAPGRDTTIITQPTQPAPDTTIVNPPSNTTIINPPADPPKTEINIETPPPPTGGGDSSGSGN